MTWLRGIDPRLLPSLLIVIQVLAAFVWAAHRDTRRALYWLAAAVLTATMTY